MKIPIINSVQSVLGHHTFFQLVAFYLTEKWQDTNNNTECTFVVNEHAYGWWVYVSNSMPRHFQAFYYFRDNKHGYGVTNDNVCHTRYWEYRNDTRIIILSGKSLTAEDVTMYWTREKLPIFVKNCLLLSSQQQKYWNLCKTANAVSFCVKKLQHLQNMSKRDFIVVVTD